MSSTFIALLRGINVSGKNKIKMTDLRGSLSSIKGVRKVETYIQSGNIVFESVKQEDELESLIHKNVLKDFGYDVPVMVRSGSYLKKALENYSFETDEPARCYFTFLEHQPKKELFDDLVALNASDDKLTLGDRVLYLYYKEKYSKSKLVNNLFERKLKQQATTRNLRTTRKLVEMANSLD